MIREIEAQLGPKEIKALSSEFIDRGVKEDAWEITEIEVSGPILKARIRMTSFYVSPTDAGGFHLTIFSTQEFLAQLSNIYLHLMAGLDQKLRETWMRECTITSRKAVRDPDNIQVEMDFFGRKNIGDGVATMVKARVFDDQGGLFKAHMKGFLR